MLPLNLDKLFRLFIVLAVIIISTFILKVTFLYVYPFFIAMLLAFLLHPLVSFTEYYTKLNRGSSTFIVMGALGSIFFAVSIIFTGRLINGLVSLAGNLPQKISDMKSALLTTGQAVTEQILSFFPFFKELSITKELNHLMENISTVVIDVTTSLLFTASEALSSVSYLLIIVVFILLAVYMLTKDYDLFKNALSAFIPKRFLVHFRPVLTYTKQSFFGLLRAQLFITSLSTLIILIGFYFFKIDHFFTLAVIIFFVDFIPYIGIGIFFIPWIIYLFISGNYVLTIEIGTLYGAVILLRQFIEPKIIAKEIGIHPFIALSILFIGYQTIGLLGVLLTPLILIFVSALHKARMFTAIYEYVYKK